MDVEKDRHVDFADAQSDFEAYRDMKQIHSAIQFEKDKKKKKPVVLIQISLPFVEFLVKVNIKIIYYSMISPYRRRIHFSLTFFFFPYSRIYFKYYQNTLLEKSQKNIFEYRRTNVKKTNIKRTNRVLLSRKTRWCGIFADKYKYTGHSTTT